MIVLCLCDFKVIGLVIEEVNVVGILVFMVDLVCVVSNVKVVSYIVTNNFSGGK